MFEHFSTARLKSRVANMAASRPFDDPEIAELRRELLARRVYKTVEQNAASLTDEQRSRIVVALNSAAA